jgi:hypothetical protein
MKKLLLIALFPSSFLNSQITLNQTDFATGGDTIRMSSSSDLTIDFSATGTNYIWDYSSLIPSSQQLKNFRPNTQLSLLSSFIFGAFAPTNYKASYFLESTDIPIDQIGSLLGIPITDMFAFTRNSVDSLTSIGFSMVVSGTEIPFKSDTIEKRYDYPIDFNNTTYSRGYTNIDLNPTVNAIYRQYRQHSSLVDGWGTITTPYGTFEALRIKHDITELDSIYIGAFSFWAPISVPPSTIYEWWTTGKKEPILRITTSTLGGNESVNTVEYRDLYRGLDAGFDELTDEFYVYPNPVKNIISLKTNKQIDKVNILDITGKIVKEISVISSQLIEINISELLQGIYYIEIQSGNTKGVQKFIKE